MVFLFEREMFGIQSALRIDRDEQVSTGQHTRRGVGDGLPNLTSVVQHAPGIHEIKLPQGVNELVAEH